MAPENRHVVSRLMMLSICAVSDDGSHLWVDGSLVVNDGGLHGPGQYLWTGLRAGARHVSGCQLDVHSAR